MSYPFIIKLLQLFKEKRQILDSMTELIKPIDEIVNAATFAYDDSLLKAESEFPKLVDELIKLNKELRIYHDEARDINVDMGHNISQCGLVIHQGYAKMMAIVEVEQNLLVGLFRKSIADINKRRKNPEAWAENLSHFGNLLDVIEADLRFAEILTQKLESRGFLDFLKGPSEEDTKNNKPIIVDNIVKSLDAGNFNEAVKWVNYGRKNEWLNREEYLFLRDAIDAAIDENTSKLEHVEARQDILNNNQIKFFRGVIEKIKSKKMAENRMRIKNEVVSAIKEEDYSRLSELVVDDNTIKVFSKDETDFLINLINSMTKINAVKFDELCSSAIFSQIFDSQDALVLREVIGQRQHEAKMQQLKGELAYFSKSLRGSSPGTLERMREEKKSRKS